jgi:hypothetical protein
MEHPPERQQLVVDIIPPAAAAHLPAPPAAEAEAPPEAAPDHTGTGTAAATDALAWSPRINRNNSRRFGESPRYQQQEEQQRRRCSLSFVHVRYSSLAWGVYVFCIITSLVDRWYGPLWPGCTWYYPRCVADEIRSDSVPLFDIIARSSGRVMMVSTSALFLTQCRVSMNFFAEHAPHWIDVGDIMHDNNALHWWIGVLGTGFPVLLHVWSGLLPQGGSADHFLDLRIDSFNRPKGEAKSIAT